jgi:hypothetical protein
MVPAFAAVACVGAGLPTAWAQGTVQPGAIVQDAGASAGADAPPWIALMAADPGSPAMRALAAQNKERKELEKRVRQIRHRYLKSGKNEVVQEGFVMLRDLLKAVDAIKSGPQDPFGAVTTGQWKVAAFPMLLEVFERDDMELRLQVLDLIRDSKTDEGDTTLAWAAVMSKDRAMRDAARGKFLARVSVRDEAKESERQFRESLPVAYAPGGGPSQRTIEMSTVGDVTVAHSRRNYPVGVARVVAEGLRTRREHTMAAAADLASVLGMFEAIPGLIAGQVSGAGFGGGAAGTDRTGDLAWIMIGQQQTFVADLTPVVGDNAVGFDPTLGVVTEGVILRIKDAAVYAYSFDVNSALVAMADTAMGLGDGQSTASMGFDTEKWMAWWDANKQQVLAAGQ